MKFKAKKILNFIESGGVYGAENVILNLSREMFKSKDYTPIVGCIVSNEKEKSDLYEKAHRMGLSSEKIVLRNARIIIDLPRAAKQIKDLKIDLIHSHGYKPSVYGFIISLISGVPIMATCHLWFMQTRLPIKMRAMIFLELLFYRFFPLIVAVSDPIKGILTRNGIPETKIKVIKNGIILDDYSLYSNEAVARLRASLGIAPDDMCLLNIARLSRQKAQWHIISAACRLKMKGKRYRYLIVGEGGLREELQQQIDRLDLKNTVQLLGFREDIRELLQLADVFLLPSLDEGMPMALLEAVASSTPVITTPVGDIPKLIKDQYSGMLVRVDDVDDLIQGIETMAGSRILRRRLASQALATMRTTYSSAKMYREYEKVYSLALG